MTNTKLAKNFSLSEFAKADVTPYTLSLLKLLASQLQIIRNALQEYAIDKKKAVTISVQSGVRVNGDYERLVKAGYNPSKTSDHFCGLQMLSKPTLGAADFKVTNCSLKLYEVADLIMKMNKDGKLDVGQVIYEYNPKKKSDWIHIGNDWNRVFNAEFLKDFYKFTRKKYLMSLDNGKTYANFNINTIKKELK